MKILEVVGIYIGIIGIFGFLKISSKITRLLLFICISRRKDWNLSQKAFIWRKDKIWKIKDNYIQIIEISLFLIKLPFQRKKREKYQNEKEMNWISNDPKNPGTLGYILVTEIKRKRQEFIK